MADVNNEEPTVAHAVEILGALLTVAVIGGCLCTCLLMSAVFSDSEYVARAEVLVAMVSGLFCVVCFVVTFG